MNETIKSLHKLAVHSVRGKGGSSTYKYAPTVVMMPLNGRDLIPASRDWFLGKALSINGGIRHYDFRDSLKY